MQNLGTIYQYGIQISGAINFGIFSFNPSLRFYNQSTIGNNLAKQHGVKNKNNKVFDSGFSSVLSLKNDFAFSVIFQYATTKENIQDNSYCDALYFISLDKTFKKNLKIGIVSALPFAKNFIYQGSDINSSDFSSSYKGTLKLPSIPLSFRISYQFISEKNRATIKRSKEKVDTRPKQGL